MMVKNILWLTGLLLLQSSSFLCFAVQFDAFPGNVFSNILRRSIRSIIENDGDGELFPIRNETDEMTNVFESNNIVELPNGGQKIEKLVEKHEINGQFQNETVSKKLTEFLKFPNHTYRKIEINGNDLAKRDESEIGCVDNTDCNSTFYCEKMSYTCKGCRSEEETCSSTDECCPGHTCDRNENVCKKSAGQEGDHCHSSSDCDKNYCCALNNNGDGVCQPYLKEGDDCGKDSFESFFSAQTSLLHESASGLPNKCPCQAGLKCKKRQSFMFIESEVCLKTLNQNKRKPKLIKISIHKLPSMSFHNDDFMDSIPLPGFLKGELPHNLKKLNNNKLSLMKKIRKLRRGRMNRPHLSFSSQKDIQKENQRKSSHRRSPFPFFDVMNPFADDPLDDIDDSEDDNDEEEDRLERRKRDDGRHKHDGQLRRNRELISNISEDARDAAHDAVDGMFDNILKGITEALKDQL